MTTAELVEAQKQESVAVANGVNNNTGSNAPLFDEPEVADMRERWQRIQAMFVDDPHACVEQADSLVASAIQRLAEVFSAEKSKLESSWSRGGDVSTEDMRQAFRRYHSFFDRILSV